MKRILVISMAFLVGPAWSHGGDPHAKAKPRELSTEEHPFGREGDPAKATRRIRVDMSDKMRFTPAEIEVRRGETVTFEVRNRGKALHEMVIGTRKELEKHAELMRKHPGMEHDEPYMAHVSPGKSGRMTWTFTQPGEFLFGCLVPGHFEAGMVGRIVVR